MDRRFIILFLLGLVVACANAAEQGTPTKFASLLSSKPAGWSDEYEQASHASFRALSVKNCDFFGPLLPSAVSYELDMACLHNGPDEWELSRQSVGTCSFRLDLLASPFLTLTATDFIWSILQNITEVTQISKYSVQCGFSHHAEECGLECEDGIVLESQGPLYAVPNVAIPGAGPLDPFDGLSECYLQSVDIVTRQFSRLLEYFQTANSAPETSSGAQQAHKAAEEPAIRLGSNLHELPRSQPNNGAKAQQYRKDATSTYTKGAAIVITGPFKLVGKHTNLKFDEGFLEMVIYAETSEGNPAIVPTSGTYIANPYRMDLQVKKRDYYKH